MSLVLTAAPAVEPVTLADAKAHCRVDGTAEDAFIDSLIVTSRLHIEAALDLALVTQSWTLRLDRWPDGREVSLPLRPIQSIDEIAITGIDGVPAPLASDSYWLDGNGTPPRLIAKSSGFPEPGVTALGIEIAFTAGFGATASDVPQAIRLALLMLIAHWFENREPVAAGTGEASRIPDTVSELLAPFRIARL
jgi:uncharacterized phiE125 gp8 family phage protein